MTGPGFEDHPEVDVPPPDSAEEPRPWQPINIETVLDGTWRPPQPTVGRRVDGVGLFYPGKVHAVNSETEAGKTWLALLACLDEIVAGHNVVYLDFEDDVGGIVGRLLAMWAKPDDLRARFTYLRPAAPLRGINADDLTGLVHDTNPSLAVIDGVTEAMDLHGLDPNKNSEAAAFGRLLPRRLADLGPATLCLDHVTKDREGRGRYAIGAVHKLNGLDGAAYILENRTPFGLGRTGKSSLRITKDRPGQLRRHGFASTNGTFWFGDLVVEGKDNDRVEVEITAPVEQDENFRPTVLMARVAAVLAQHGPLSQRRIRAAVKGNDKQISAALDYLILDGYVTDKSPHKLDQPYPPEEGKP